MNIGDSFLCKNPDKVRYSAKRFGYRVTIRLTKEDVLTNYRVWLIN